MKHYNITIQGNLKKTDFAFVAKAISDQSGAKGFLVNMPDGSIYIEAEGDEFEIVPLLEFCKEGPDGVEVISVDVEESLALQGFKDFVVKKRIN